MADVINLIIAHAPEVLTALTSIIAGASVLANFTATDIDNKAVGLLSKAVHFLAANFTSGSVK